MKLSENVMTGLMIVLGILPFIWFTYLGKKASGKSKNKIKELLKKEDLNFGEKEFWNHNFIGIDEVKHQLLFVKLTPTENHITRLDLHDVKSCLIQKTTRDFKIDKRSESELQMLNLDFTFVSNKPKESLNFYDITEGLSEDFEMKRAEKWQQEIQKNNASVAA